MWSRLYMIGLTLYFNHSFLSRIYGPAETRDFINRRRKREEGRFMEDLDYLLVPLGLALFIVYNAWLLVTIIRNPKRTVIGLNAESRREWAFSMMADPLKNGVLIVQTIRNNIMASSLMATAAITLCSLISVQVSSKSGLSSLSTEMEKGYKNFAASSSVKYLAILLCFLLAFLCNVQSVRYYAHVSFLATLPTSKGTRESIEYVASNLNRGAYFWSLGLRAFYLSFPLFLWVFGAIPMFVGCCVMSFVLYFLDTTFRCNMDLHNKSMYDESKANDVEGAHHSVQTEQFEDLNIRFPLLNGQTQVQPSVFS
ncbi:uncharacterized protein LOC124919645 [Impatiens glandulifera]|uniref:uncharacterized protein LOC124919645 n=1 Tax=Impatiens glandulifera TaxID=253017 RepID=UPI001FB1785F|nr:uncharacterized protein LOC124919645 [Impatiens glandulifera]